MTEQSNPQNQDPPITVSVQDAARLVGRDEKTIRRWITKGGMPSIDPPAGTTRGRMVEVDILQEWHRRHSSPRRPLDGELLPEEGDETMMMQRAGHAPPEYSLEHALGRLSHQNKDVAVALRTLAEGIAIGNTAMERAASLLEQNVANQQRQLENQERLMQTLLSLFGQGESARMAREEASAEMAETLTRCLLEARTAQATAEERARLLVEGVPEPAAPPAPRRPAPRGVLGRALRWAERH